MYLALHNPLAKVCQQFDLHQQENSRITPLQPNCQRQSPCRANNKAHRHRITQQEPRRLSRVISQQRNPRIERIGHGIRSPKDEFPLQSVVCARLIHHSKKDGTRAGGEAGEIVGSPFQAERDAVPDGEVEGGEKADEEGEVDDGATFLEGVAEPAVAEGRYYYDGADRGGVSINLGNRVSGRCELCRPIEVCV